VLDGANRPRWVKDFEQDLEASAHRAPRYSPGANEQRLPGRRSRISRDAERISKVVGLGAARKTVRKYCYPDVSRRVEVREGRGPDEEILVGGVESGGAGGG
jgi:hypothetical protein